MLLSIVKLIKKINKSLTKNSRFFDDLVNHEGFYNRHKFIRFFISTLFGAFMSIILLLVNSIAMKIDFNSIMVLLLVLLCSLISGFSVNFRCILTLIGFESFSRGGRNFFRAALIIVLVVGPVNNIVVNSIELVRTFECSMNLAYEVTLTKYKLMFQPYVNAIGKLNFNNVEGKYDLLSRKIENIVEKVIEHEKDESK
jgi:hypothetical protein